ncbi:MAG: HD family phosphohydrolase [Saprospirales bacterium]|nr:HD family phosphohydrolase [Saprospirales bacterium]
MSSTAEDILDRVSGHLEVFFRKRIEDAYVFHEFQHTRQVVDAVEELCNHVGIDGEKRLLLKIAAWFHDAGYDKGPEGHEQRSAAYAREFMQGKGFSEGDIAFVERCILATNTNTTPTDEYEMLLRDADLSHLGKANYWERCSRIRQELALTRNKIMSEAEWVTFEIDFLTRHSYFTEAARQLYGEGKARHLQQLFKHRRRVSPEAAPPVLPKAKKKKKKKQNKALDGTKDLDFNLGRGVETMYRTTYRTHVNLSAIADNKANIMLSMNAIVLSIALPQLMPRFGTDARLIIPSLMLLATCLTAIILATLATKPKITEGRFTRDDIEKRSANLLFFGNFYKMKLDDFHWGMMEMIRDKDFLYSSMTKDIYFLGVVLAKKFRFLSYCYSVFMYGMIATVLAFAVSFLI